MEKIENKDDIKAVKLMRDVREKISLETQNMTFQELKDYIKKGTKNSKTKSIGK